MDRKIYYDTGDAGESVFSINTTSMKFGPGALAELGYEAAARGVSRVAFFVDKAVRETDPSAIALDALQKAGIDAAVYDDCHIEPNDISISAAGEFARAGNFDGYVSLGGGSVMDTAKAANLLATYPGEVLDYIFAPLGGGKPAPGPIKPHIACPTTCGTGAETSVVSIFDLAEKQVKAGISSPYLRPTLAVVDPETTRSLPAGVVASTGFDVLCHAIESYTARPFSDREKVSAPSQRPPYQGANPYSDIGSMAAIRLGGRFLVRAVADAEDFEARRQLMFASSLAGMAFGNAGVNVPHAMATAVAALKHVYRARGYENVDPMIPHGVSVVTSAPAAFRFSAPAAPERFLEVAAALGAETDGAPEEKAGELLADRLIAMMKETGVATGLSELGYAEADIPLLAERAFASKRLLTIAPREVGLEDLLAMFKDAMSYD